MKNYLALALLAFPLFAGATTYTLDLSSATFATTDDPSVRRAELCSSSPIPTLALGDEITITTGNGLSVSAVIDTTLPASFAGGYNLSGKLPDGSHGLSICRLGEDLHMEIRLAAEALLYKIVRHGDRILIEEVNLQLIQRGKCITPDSSNRQRGGDSVLTSRTLLAAPGNIFDDNITAPAPVMIDVMLVFDNGARAWVENNPTYSGSITNFAITAINNVNSTLVNTGLDSALFFRLVDVVTVDARVAEITSTVESPMINAVTGGEGTWDVVATRREKCGADLVSLMIDPTASLDILGHGRITKGESEASWLEQTTQCYSCCAVRAVAVDCTLAHEMGHNLGLAHSKTVKNGWGQSSFSYANGYNFVGNDGGHYHTIMAYNTDTQYNGYYTEIPYFSSPDYTYAGVPVGDEADANATKALRLTCSAISKRQDVKIPLPSDIQFSPSTSEAHTIVLSTFGNYEIRYTLDGSEPTRESMLFNDAIYVDGDVTVKAVAVVDENTLGAVAQKSYTDAIEFDEYAVLEEPPSDSRWTMWYWTKQDGGDAYYYYWNTPRNAILDIGGTININSAVSLATLFADGTLPLTISTSDYLLSATSFDVLGTVQLTGTNYAFDNWKLHPGSTLVLAPGAGNIYVLNKALALSDTSSCLTVSNGTLSVSADGSPVGPFGSCALRIAKDGILSIEDNGWKTGYQNSSPLVIDDGGTMRINYLDSLHRPLTLNGGTIEINYSGRALDFNDLTITVNADSSIKAINSDGKIVIRQADVAVKVVKDATLVLDAGTMNGGSGLQSINKGINKEGNGTLIVKRELAHDGATKVSCGTLAVDFTSTAPSGAGWIVSGGATLRINEGKVLAVPSLSCSSGSILSLPASSSAPIAVSGDVNLFGVKFELAGADNQTQGTKYPLLASGGTISGVSLLSKDGLPQLDQSLGWIYKVEDGVLYAQVTTAEEAGKKVNFICNNTSFEAQAPSDASIVADSAVKLTNSPVLVSGPATKAFALSLDVEIPEGELESEAVICEWNLDTHLIRCVRKTDGTLDCFYDGSGHVNNSVASYTLSPGHHVIRIGYYSDKNNGGTWVYADGEPAYKASSLKWADYGVGNIAIGGKIDGNSVYENLIVRNIAVIDAISNDPLSKLTSSGGSVSYNYLAAKSPCIFPLTPAGGYETDETVFIANFNDTYEKASVSVVASFPYDKSGAIISAWYWYKPPQSNGGWYSIQVEYEGNGEFGISYNGYEATSNYKTKLANNDVEKPHVYTMTFSVAAGVIFYQDNVEIMSYPTFNKAPLKGQISFGCGLWNQWTSTSYNPMPMPDFKVYASHIAFGTDDVAASADETLASLNFDSAYNSLSIAEKLSYLPEYQTASGVVAAPDLAPDDPEEPEEIVPPATPAVVDVLVAYDLGAQAYVADKNQTLEEFAQTQIDLMNEVLITNKLDRYYSYKLAGICKVDAVYNNINTAPALIAAGEGPAVSLRAAREIYGADTVTLLVDTTGATIGNSSPLTSTANVADQHECAFSVCSIRAVDTGKQHTMIHENAHNMGCGHARAQSVISSPFEYGRGYYFDDNGTTRHTIMAYGGDNDASWYFSTTSKAFGLKLGDANNNNARVLRETCAEVAKWREGTAIDIDGVEVGGVTWKTSALYPWTVEGDAIRSYNQTDYTNPCTTPLKATITGPKRLTFKHKSYFGGESVSENDYSHFDVLLDDSPVIAQNEYNTDWTEAYVDVPEGEHEVIFVFSLRFAMNNPLDNKDGNAEANDAVWLKDIVLADFQTVECTHSSTSDDVEWVFPYDFEATAIDGNLAGVEVGSKGIVESLNFSTNAVCASVLAELPEGAAGIIIGCQLKRSSETLYAFAYSNGNGTFSLGHTDTTDTATSSEVENWTAPHVWTFAFGAQTGAKLYCDSKEIASTTVIQWASSEISGPITFGNDRRNKYPLPGMKIYSVHTDFGVGSAIFKRTDDSANQTMQSLGVLADFAGENAKNQVAAFNLYNATGSIDPEVTHACVLRISEIMPKPTDDQNPGQREGMDVNGLESGWVEVENTSPDKWADLADYRFIRTNRGKKTGQNGKKVTNLPSRLVPPHSKTVFYTSERYPNSDEQAESAFATGTFDAKPAIYEDLNNVMVYGKKVNPKKSPFVRLYYAPGSKIKSVVDTVVIPSDVPEGYSIIVGAAEESKGTRRWLCPTPTRGTENTKTNGLTMLGPNVGPQYERPAQDDMPYNNEFAIPAPPAKPGEDYTITLPVNPVMNPDGSFVPREKDKIKSLKLVYRKNLDDNTKVTADIDLATKIADDDWGDLYTATIPAGYILESERGHLIQWKVLITDGEGVEWTSPSFNNKDDGYEWYGTIVEPDKATQMSATLPTWHMFASGNHLTQMDVDKDAQNKSLVPNYARIAIYDSSTSNYYDYVRIDLRGNTSAGFTKKSHGLRFAKAHPLTMTDIVSGKEIKEIRKTSLISEYADPSYMRQMVAFWLWNKMGNKVPFDFPVRCNLNGEFYQLAFNSERFTDELIEDVYELDKYGYSYKNVGTLNKLTTAGGTEKKTPDDENETDLSVLRSNLEEPLIARGANQSHDTKGNNDLTKFVVEKFDLPAWINYLASARITQEMDDVWANVCAYYDNPTMKEGERGTGTWMPLGYDFNLSFGQWHYADLNGERFGLMSNQDSFKSHPLYGGWTILAGKNGNNGFEAIYQSPKFRRLYLRRLRTLMDQELKEPGTAEGATPFMLKMRKLAGLMRADAARDIEKWPNDDTDNKIQVWTDDARPADMDAGINDIWNNYVVPRREHLYVTHSITNTDFDVGYAADKNAGIPEAQSPLDDLMPNIEVDTTDITDGMVVIRNNNDEVVDMSGWTLNTGKKGVYTLPAGTVCDAKDCIYVVSDRRAYIKAHESELTDQVIIGNATFGDASSSSITVPEVEDTASEGVSGDDVEVIIPVTNEEDAQKWAAGTPAAVTKEQAGAGLDPKYLKVEAKSVATESGTYYQAVVVLNEAAFEDKEKKPEVDTEKPVSIEEDEEGKKLSATISNAVQGLWYGYAVSESLGNSNDYKNDVDSFARATGKSITIKSSAREQTKEREFFIVRGLLTKPTE